jgi:hypothetical protein
VLARPADAFAQDLAPVSRPLPVQRLLVLIAACLLPLEIGLRRLRFSLSDVISWLRHPRRIAVGLPRWSPELPLQAPAWMPGAWKTRPVPSPIVWRTRSVSTEGSLGGHVTPGLARETAIEGEADAEDALAATLRWMSARRGSRPDSG